MSNDEFEYTYAFIATNGRSAHVATYTTPWLTSKNGRYDIDDLLEEGWEPFRETTPTFSIQQILQNGSTFEDNVGVSLVVLRRQRRES